MAVPTLEDLKKALIDSFPGLSLEIIYNELADKNELVHENTQYVVTMSIREFPGSSRWPSGYLISFSHDSKFDNSGGRFADKSLNELIESIKAYKLDKYFELKDFEILRLF